MSMHLSKPVSVCHQTVSINMFHKPLQYFCMTAKADFLFVQELFACIVAAGQCVSFKTLLYHMPLCLYAAIRSIVASSSIKQSVKGILTAGEQHLRDNLFLRSSLIMLHLSHQDFKRHSCIALKNYRKWHAVSLYPGINSQCVGCMYCHLDHWDKAHTYAVVLICHQCCVCNTDQLIASGKKA